MLIMPRLDTNIIGRLTLVVSEKTSALSVLNLPKLATGSLILVATPG